MTVNGLQLRYMDWGPEGKQPMVCMHGHTAEARSWDDFAEATSPNYNDYALDVHHEMNPE